MTENPPKSPPNIGVLIVLCALVLATAAKAVWALNSLGSTDTTLFYVYGYELQKLSMARLYQESPLFNHTPFTGWLVKTLYGWAHGIDPTTNGDYVLFSSAFRFLSIFADMGVVTGLLFLRRTLSGPPWWALALFAASPVSIMVSGFHGNVDPIMVMLLFLAAVALYCGRPALCGALFGLAFNVKIVPLLLAPVFFFYWVGRSRLAALKFAGAAGGLMLAGIAWPLVHCPAGFIHNVFGYGSYWGGWGVSYWLRLTGGADFQKVSYTGLSAAQSAVMLALKVIIISAVLTLAWRRRRVAPKDFFATLAAAFTLIFIFAPGTGPQYMVWFAPFLLVAEPKWWAAVTAASTVYMAAFYHSASNFTFPWDQAKPMETEFRYWMPWTNLVWGLFIALLVLRAGRWWMVERGALSSSAEADGDKEIEAEAKPLADVL